MPRVHLIYRGPRVHSPFHIPGFDQGFPHGNPVEITEQALARHGRTDAKQFAEFVAGIYNANRHEPWLEVRVADDPKPEPAAVIATPAPTTPTASSPSTTTTSKETQS